MCFNITGVTKFSKEIAENGLGKPKVSLQCELDGSGMCNLIKAEVTVDEMVTVKEVVEVDDDKGANNVTEPSNETVVPVEAEGKVDVVPPNPEEAVAKNITAESKEDIKSNNETKRENEKSQKKKKKKKMKEVGFIYPLCCSQNFPPHRINFNCISNKPMTDFVNM
jgi:hypoxia up-regulated 1